MGQTEGNSLRGVYPAGFFPVDIARDFPDFFLDSPFRLWAVELRRKWFPPSEKAPATVQGVGW